MPMPEQPDWRSTSWEGNRLRQHREYLALPFREKLRRLEQMAEVAALLAARRRAREVAQGRP
jgi:hypothetical protein